MPLSHAASSVRSASGSSTRLNMLPRGAPPNPSGPGGLKRDRAIVCPSSSILAHEMTTNRMVAVGREFQPCGATGALPGCRTALGDGERFLNRTAGGALAGAHSGSGGTVEGDAVATLGQDAEIEAAVAGGGARGNHAAWIAAELDIDPLQRGSGKKRRCRQRENHQRNGEAQHRFLL